jgi:hypothetical protein
MRRYDAAGRDIRNRKLHVVAGARRDLNVAEDGSPAKFVGSGKVVAHAEIQWSVIGNQ